MVIFPKGDSYK